MSAANASSRSRSLSKLAPLAYVAIAYALVVLLLPTVLRPPKTSPPSGAELAPDAPPDQNPDSIVSTLSRGVTATAGAGDAANGEPLGPGGGVAGAAPGTASALPGAPPRACPRGFGNPPRQTESIYAPACARAWIGDNGGATAKGVTGSEIRAGYTGGVYLSIGEGPISRTTPSNDNAMLRTFRVMQAYFNTAFQFYGRYMQFYAASPNTGDEAGQRAAVVRADDQYHVFSTGMNSAAACEESARRKLVSFCQYAPHSLYAQGAPYLWSWFAEGTQLMSASAELICKQLAGKPAAFAGTPDMQSAVRRFGIVYYDRYGSARDGYSDNFGPNADTLAQMLNRCGQHATEIGFEDVSTSSFATAIGRLRADGVTTVVPLMSYVDLTTLTNAAAGNGYVPEWVVTGTGLNDHNYVGYIPNQAEWSHAFGSTSLEMERNKQLTDCFRAYHAIDPNSDPDEVFCHEVFGSLFMFAAGVQMAGPNLNGQTFRDGLYRMGYRFPDRPVWAIGGGYGPDDFGYTDNVTLTWWDPSATDPYSGQPRGAYKYLDGGRRYRIGSLPSQGARFFEEGVTTTPDSDIEP